MILRAVNDSKTLKEYSFDFDVSSSGTSSTSNSSSTTASSSGSSSSAGFGPVSPVQGATMSTSPQLTWGRHSSADRYYVRLIDRSVTVDRMQDKITAAELGCSSGGNCTLQYSGSELRNETHRLIVRALNGSTKLDEFTIDFDASSSQGAGSSSTTTWTAEADAGGASSSSGGTVVAISPTNSTTDRTPTLTWQGGGFDKYYIKVVAASGATAFSGNVSPSAAGCANSSNCSYTLSTLSTGSYLWRVRGVTNGIQTAYSSLDITIR